MVYRAARGFVLLMAFGAALLLSASAQENASEPVAGLKVAESGEHGSFLTDAAGRSVYLFVNDQAAEPYQEPHLSTCYEQCAANWPPVLVATWPPEQGEFMGEGVDESLVSTVEREDGSLQVTYGNWPLYYFIGDEEPGQTNGQGIRDVWFLVATDATAIGREDPEQGDAGQGQAEGDGEGQEAKEQPADESRAQQESEDQSEVQAAMMEHGASVFANNCAVCHGEEGQGAQGPRLSEGTRTIGNAERLIRQIMRGGELMPGFRHLSDKDIAAVATFVRNSWQNDHGPISPEEVSEWR